MAAENKIAVNQFLAFRYDNDVMEILVCKSYFR